MFDRSHSGCQDRGRETIFMGLSGRRFLSPRVSPRLAVLYSLYQFGRKQLPSNKAACKQNRHKLGTVVEAWVYAKPANFLKATDLVI